MIGCPYTAGLFDKSAAGFANLPHKVLWNRAQIEVFWEV